MSSSKKFFTKEKREAVEATIAEAEKQTSGEIRLFIEDNCKGDVLDRAAFIFKHLKMHETELRNGVLFYLALNSHKFAIIGDAGIHSKVHQDFWNKIKEEMSDQFSKGNFAEGLNDGIRKAGEALKKHFPYDKADVNELPDKIEFGEE